MWNPANWAITDAIQGQGSWGDAAKAAVKVAVPQLISADRVKDSYEGAVNNVGSTGFPSSDANGTTPPSPQNTGGDISEVLGTNTGSGSGSAGSLGSADEQAYWQDQLTYLNNLLGGVQGRLSTGLSNIANKFAETTSDINDQESRSNRDLLLARENNQKEKQTGIMNVDNFANNSFNSLQRLLAGGNAGRSSVGRELIPTLVSKAAGTRRQGVLENAGQNERGIDISQEDATSQFSKVRRDAEAERRSREESFRTGIAQQEQDIYGNLYDAGTKMDMAGGASWKTANANRQNYKTEADSRNAYIDQLFNQYALPSFTPNQVTTKAPELSKYTVDPAKLQTQSSGVSDELLPYLPNARKKAQGMA